jgi:peptidyl-prolyl cis-trans isomerase D
MLRVMRDNFQHLKWALLAVVAAFIIGFVYVDMGLGGAGRSTAADDRTYAAKVNGDTITARDYSRALYYTEKNYEQMYKQPLSPEMIAAMGLSKQVVDSLIDQQLLLQQAERIHLTATQEDIRRKILEIPMLNPDGKFVGAELYTRYVTGALGYQSPAEFENELGREITLRKLESAMSNSVVVSPKAAEAEYRRISENAKIRYVLYPAAREAAAVSVTPAEVESYYKTHQAQYSHGEQRAIKYLVADTNRIRQQINPTDADLLKRYQADKESYKRQAAAHILHILVKVDPTAAPAVDAAAKAKAEGLVKQLRAGADFAALAKANSDDPSSSTKGGDMGFVDQGTTVDPFDQAAFNMPLNQISDPIRSKDFGYHIIKVLERRPAGYRAFDEVKGLIASQYVDQTAKDQGRDEITRLENRIKQNKPKTKEEFSALATGGVSSNDSLWFAKSDAIPGIGNNGAINAWAFSAKEGDVGEIIGTQRGPAIPYLYSVRPAGISELNDIRSKVENDARMEKARQAANQKIAAALPASNVDDLAKKLGLTAAEATVTRQGFISGFQGDTTSLIDAAMVSPVGQVSKPVSVGDGAVVFQVLEQKKVEPKDVAENKASYSEMLRQQEARNLRQVLLQRLRKAAKIEINDKVITPPQQQAGA